MKDIVSQFAKKDQEGKVKLEGFKVHAGCYLCELCMIFLCSWCPHELGIKCN